MPILVSGLMTKHCPYPVNQQETIDFKVLIGYKKPPPKWKKPFNGIPVEALSKEN
jgi:hypothetical protein